MDDPSPDSRKAQVKELEQIVKKLQQENEQLLNKVAQPFRIKCKCIISPYW